jgi:hypothetical protein
VSLGPPAQQTADPCLPSTAWLAATSLAPWSRPAHRTAARTTAHHSSTESAFSQGKLIRALGSRYSASSNAYHSHHQLQLNSPFSLVSQSAHIELNQPIPRRQTDGNGPSTTTTCSRCAVVCIAVLVVVSTCCSNGIGCNEFTSKHNAKLYSIR